MLARDIARLAFFPLLLVVALAGCDEQNQADDLADAPADDLADAPDIVEAAIEAGIFQTLVAAVQAAGLVETLQGEGPFTVFAPTDEAFARLPAGTVESLLLEENRDQLIAILTYHVVPGEYLAADVLSSNSLPTVQGQDLAIRLDGDTPKVNESAITQTDIRTSNGVIHIIDTVLLPN
jgi:uncharacterized surface protein with fasciclin (FAS1) repeats